MQEYFIALVDGTVEASIKYVREYVHAYLSDMLEDARDEIREYGHSFNTTMVAALHTRQQGGPSYIQLMLLSCLHRSDSFTITVIITKQKGGPRQRVHTHLCISSPKGIL